MPELGVEHEVPEVVPDPTHEQRAGNIRDNHETSELSSDFSGLDGKCLPVDLTRNPAQRLECVS
jgi:hypothetical protein